MPVRLSVAKQSNTGGNSNPLVQRVIAQAGQVTVATGFQYVPGTNRLQVWINGVYQYLGDDYEETSEFEIRFTAPLETGDVVFLRYG